MFHSAENPIPNLKTLLTVLAILISWPFSPSLYFDEAIAYLDIQYMNKILPHASQMYKISREREKNLIPFTVKTLSRFKWLKKRL